MRLLFVNIKTMLLAEQTISKIFISGFKIFFILIAALVATKLIHSFIKRFLRKLLKAKNVNFKKLKVKADIKIEEKRLITLEKVSYSAIKLIIWVIALLTILPELGINITPLLAGLGIGGLALGFGARNLVQDYISGLFILLEDQYRVGEEVEITGIKGIVEDFSLRRTVLKDENGAYCHIPNSQIKKATNFSR